MLSRLTAFLPVFLALLLPFGAAGGQTPPPPSSGRLHPAEDLRVSLSYGQLDVFDEPVCSPGHADRILVVRRALVLNVWSLFTWYWPEYLAILPGIPVAVLVILIVRRRQLERGKWYCRRCRHEVAEPPPRHCPVCESEFDKRHKPISGIAAIPLLLLMGAVLAVTAVGYSTFLRGQPRFGSWSDWVRWPTVWARQLAERWELKELLASAGHYQRLCEVDVATGDQTRAIGLFPPGAVRLTPDPDGKQLYVTVMEQTRNGTMVSRAWSVHFPAGRVERGDSTLLRTIETIRTAAIPRTLHDLTFPARRAAMTEYTDAREPSAAPVRLDLGENPKCDVVTATPDREWLVGIAGPSLTSRRTLESSVYLFDAASGRRIEMWEPSRHLFQFAVFFTPDSGYCIVHESGSHQLLVFDLREAIERSASATELQP